MTPLVTPNGHLPAGTYRYRYAAWKGTPSQATAPSPSSDITFSTSVSYEHTWTEADFSGSGTAQPDVPDGLWKQVGTWTPSTSGSLTIPAPGDDGFSGEMDYLVYDPTWVHRWGLMDAYGYWSGTRPVGAWRFYGDEESFDSGVEYILAIYAWADGDFSSVVGHTSTFASFVEALTPFGEVNLSAGGSSSSGAVTLTYPTIDGADGYLVYREAL